MLEPSWDHLGASLAILSDFGALLDHFGGHLGPFWVLLGAFLGQLGAILGNLRPSWAILGPSWEQELLRQLRQAATKGGLLYFSLFRSPFWDPKFVQVLYFFGHFFDNLLVTVWATLGLILGSILGPDRPKKGAR